MLDDNVRNIEDRLNSLQQFTFDIELLQLYNESRKLISGALNKRKGHT